MEFGGKKISWFHRALPELLIHSLNWCIGCVGRSLCVISVSLWAGRWDGATVWSSSTAGICCSSSATSSPSSPPSSRSPSRPRWHTHTHTLTLECWRSRCELIGACVCAAEPVVVWRLQYFDGNLHPAGVGRRVTILQLLSEIQREFMRLFLNYRYDYSFY